VGQLYPAVGQLLSPLVKMGQGWLVRIGQYWLVERGLVALTGCGMSPLMIRYWDHRMDRTWSASVTQIP
jgi:hypothetical protein